MVSSQETLFYKKKGFDWDKYIQLQKNQILERISKFPGRLYLEIGGKFMTDAHASRVLPWFDVATKKLIFQDLQDKAEILFCVNAEDIISNRQLSNENISYSKYVENMVRIIERNVGIKPHIVINKIDVGSMFDIVLDFEHKFQRLGFRVWERYKINWYPHATDLVLSDTGFGNDDHIPLTKNLILVTWAASNSGKMSTCLGQIYLDKQIDITSGYAKYETFPIWNLPLNHPVNLAYEAATADIWDYNCLDTYHQSAYSHEAVNYNRDVDGFEIVSEIARKIVNHKNYMVKYKSPTDMGISCAGFCISDDEVVSIASLQEIQRRKTWYQEIVDRWEGEQSWVDKCDELEKKALEYCNSKWYNLKLDLV